MFWNQTNHLSNVFKMDTDASQFRTANSFYVFKTVKKLHLFPGSSQFGQKAA